MAPRRRAGAATLVVVAVVLITLVSTVVLPTALADQRGPGATTVDPSGTIEGTVHLANASTTVTTFTGERLERAGHEVVGSVDVNGDGNVDVLVAAPLADRNGPNSGAIYVYYGPVRDGELNVSDADLTLVGAERDRAGRSLAVGDFDGDGVADVAVGAPRNGAAGANAGRVYVVLGEDRTGRVRLPVEADATFTGAAAGDQAGYSVAAISPGPDARGSLLVVGAPGNDSASGGENAGAAYLLAEPLSADGSRLDGAATATVLGTHQGEGAGYSVASAGDVNGDDRSEVLVGAPSSDSRGGNAGAVYVLGTDRTGHVNASSGVVLTGAHATDRAGQAIASAGDVNDDGVADVIVGAPTHDVVDPATGNVTKPEAGAAYLLYGPITDDRSLDRADVTLYGEHAGDRAGWSVAAAGSANGNCDGIDDVLVGAPFADAAGNDSGVAYLVYGNGASIVRSLSTAGATFQGDGDGSLAGWAVSGGDDTSGDGRTDVLLSATGAEPGGNESGAAYLVEGDCPVVPETSPASTPGTATPGAAAT